MDKRINQISDKYICPYCFREIKLKDIQFKSNNPNITLFTPDTLFIDYWKNRDSAFSDRPRDTAMTPRAKGYGLYKALNSANKYVPVAYSDEGGYLTQHRLCPSCHNTLSPTIGFVNTLNFVVIGPDNDVSYKYVKDLFCSINSGLKNNDMTIPHIKFYIPDACVSSKIQNDSDALNKEDYPSLTGTVIVPDSRGKAYCECTVTYLPFSSEYMKAAEKNLKGTLADDALMNTNAIILVSDYQNIVEYNDNGIKRPEILEKYIISIKNRVGMAASSERSIPIAVVLTNSEYAGELQANATSDKISRQALSLAYEAETEKRQTSEFVSSFNNQIVLSIEAVFKDNCFFSVPIDERKNIKCFQNPLHWLLGEFGCENVVKEKKKAQEGK